MAERCGTRAWNFPRWRSDPPRRRRWTAVRSADRGGRMSMVRGGHTGGFPAGDLRVEAAPSEDPFEAIEPSGSRDYLLRNTHQALVALTTQADIKASIV